MVKAALRRSSSLEPQFQNHFLQFPDLQQGEWHHRHGHSAPNRPGKGIDKITLVACPADGQIELYSPIAGQAGALCQWHGCHPPRYRSVDHKSDFKVEKRRTAAFSLALLNIIKAFILI